MTGLAARVATGIATRAVFLCLLAGCAERASSGAAPAVFFQTDSSQPHFGAAMVASLDARVLAKLDRNRPVVTEWQRIFAVHAGDTTGLPMLGTYAVAND